MECEFSGVFLEETPGLQHVREINFTIKLVSGMTPISKASYRAHDPSRFKRIDSLVAKLVR